MKERKAKKVLKAIAPVAGELVKIWLGGKAYRVSKEIFELIRTAENENEAIKFLNK